MTIPDVYPRGEDIPLAVMDVRANTLSTTTTTQSDVNAVVAAKFNVVHSISSSTPLGSLAETGNARVLYTLPDLGPFTDLGATHINAGESHNSVSWWQMPDGTGPASGAARIQTLRDYAWQTRNADAQQRPNFHRFPSDIGSTQLQDFAQYDIDVWGMSCFACNWSPSWPNAWVRYRIESCVTALTAAGKTIGRKYLAGEKTIIAVAELFDDVSQVGGRVQTAKTTRHNVWQAFCSGARGLGVYAYSRRNDNRLNAPIPPLGEAWTELSAIAGILTGAHQVGKAILFGTKANLTHIYVAGPSTLPAFTPTSDPAVTYGSVDVRGLLYREHLYLIVVNSHETSAVTVEVRGIPAGVTSGNDILTSEGYTVSGNALQVTLAALQPRVIKLRRTARFPSQMIIVVPLADRDTVEYYATLDLEGCTEDNKTFVRGLAAAPGAATHYGCQLAVSAEGVTAVKAWAARLPNLKYYQVDNFGDFALQATNSSTAAARVGEVDWTFTKSIADLSLVKV